MHESEIFSGIDLSSAFLQLNLAETSRKYTSFTFEGQRYEFQRAMWGLRNISIIFQTIMERLFADSSSYTVIYIDDITVHSKTWTEHLVHLTDVITRLTEAGFRINFDKTHLGRREIRLLGFLKSKDGIRFDCERLRHFEKLPGPKTGGEILAMMGMFNHLRDHIPMYAHIAAPMESLRTVKDITSELWNNNQHIRLHLIR